MNADIVPFACPVPDRGDAAIQEHEARERALFYVAATRARDIVIITSWGQRSHFLDGLDSVSADEARADPGTTGMIGRRRLKSWQMTLSEWRKRKEVLKEKNDIEGLREIGGMTGDYPHRRRVQQAVEEGLPVPPGVLDDYPDLRDMPPRLDGEPTPGD